MEEWAKWTPDLDMFFVGYNSVARRAPNAQGKMLKTLPVPYAELKGPWDTVICDEAHALVNPKADWTQAVSKIQSDRLYLATGTPIPNWAQDLLQPLRMIFPGDRRFTNKRKWQEYWFNMWDPPWGGQRRPYINSATGSLLLEDWTWEDFWMENGLDGPDGRMLLREVDLGVPFTEEDRWVDMTTKQAKVYRDLKQQYIAWMPSGEEVSAWSDGGLHTKLMQVSTGLEVLDDNSQGSGKFDEVRHVLEDSVGHSTLLFCQFRRSADHCGRVAGSLGLKAGVIHGGVDYTDRDNVRRAFQNGDLDVLVGTLGTIAVGITLDRASTEVFVEHSWSPWRNDQAIKRAMVQGKKSHVHVIHLWTRKTVDGGMRSAMQDKTDQQVKAFSARQFRQILEG